MPIPQPTEASQFSLLSQGWEFQISLSDTTPVRPALSRVWRGYLMTAYQSNASDKSIYYRFYDTYGTPGNGSSWLGRNHANLVTQSGVALYYANLTLYVFFVMSNGGTNELVYSWAAQPAVTVQNKSNWNFAAPNFSPAQGVEVGATPNNLGPAVAAFGSNLWLVFATSTEPASGSSNLYAIQSPLPGLTPGLSFGLNTEGTVKDSSGTPVTTIGEPTLVSFRGALYCFFTGAGNLVQYVRLDKPGAVVTVGQGVASDAAAAVTCDPTGTLVVLCYKVPGSGGQQIGFTCSPDLNTWQTPQMIAGQLTRGAPTLYASPSGEIVLMFRGSSSQNKLYSMNPSQYWYLPNGVNAIPPS